MKLSLAHLVILVAATCCLWGCGDGATDQPCLEQSKRCSQGALQQCKKGAWAQVDDCHARGLGCSDMGTDFQCLGEIDAGGKADAGGGKPDANGAGGDGAVATPDSKVVEPEAEPPESDSATVLDGQSDSQEAGGQDPTEEPTCPLTQAEFYAVPTFNSLGLYWKPSGGASDNECLLSYRKKGSGTDWKEGLPLWFDNTNHPGLEERSKEYRGSLVNLEAGTLYEIKLQLKKTGKEKTCTARTWRQDPPIAKTVTLPAGTIKGTYTIEESGSKNGYVLYDASQTTVKGGKTNLEVNASYIVLRGLKAQDAEVHGIKLGNVHDVFIEDCDVSGWGRILSDGFGENLDAAVYSDSNQLERIVVQRCALHHPRSNSNSWAQSRPLTGQGAHPYGPQGIVFRGSKGNNVIRNNHIYSDEEHCFNDGMGEIKNFSFEGFPNRDSDIHDNKISNVWDDAIESEGANMNVRIWGNFAENVMIPHGCATTSLGPLYLFRNTNGRTRADASGKLGSGFVKLGYSQAKDDFVHGKMYLFHNTILQPENHGPRFGFLITAEGYHQYNVTSRNNILHVHESPSISAKADLEGSSFDYDLYNASAPQEPHGFHGTPTYESSPDGRPWLKAGTLGFDKGVRLPNFNDDFLGEGPEPGAYENGSPAP